jgi:hypothetical protein
MNAAASSTAAPDEAPVTTLLRAISVPAIGTHWVEQGGIFAGVIRGIDGAPDAALIIADDPRGHFEDREWGPYGKDVATDAHDGMANTVAMTGAGSQLAADILALDIAGHTDWYLPSASDLHLAYANLADHFDRADYYWSSTQYSPYYAWAQDFEGGYSSLYGKHGEFRAVAVRRFVL